MQLPFTLLESLRTTQGFTEEAFKAVHISGEQVTSIRLNPARPVRPFSDQTTRQLTKIPWTDSGFYLAERPSFTFDPLFHAGCYYVQEASSMFLEQAFKQTVDLAKPIKVLDLCAAPGGKSTHIHSLLSKDSVLVSNEVIRSRVNILKDNIIKWGCENVMITNNDPKDIGKLEGYFDVIVIDAPCSGSGLFRRDPEAIATWSENNVQLCSQRQQRILADIIPALKGNGVLIYSTCSYSREEDEGIVSWFLKEFPVDHFPLTVDPSWGIVDTGKGYRFWPDKVKGEGFFLSVFKKVAGDHSREREDRRQELGPGKQKLQLVAKKEMELLEKWLDTAALSLIKNKDTIYAWPENLAGAFNYLLQELKVVYSGVLVGELIRDKLVPDHALAMSGSVRDGIPRIELDRENAIRYLQRKPIELPNAGTGWQLVTYQQIPLGWVNALSNRVNNYYPKELRILKDSETG